MEKARWLPFFSSFFRWNLCGAIFRFSFLDRFAIFFSPSLCDKATADVEVLLKDVWTGPGS